MPVKIGRTEIFGRQSCWANKYIWGCVPQLKCTRLYEMYSFCSKYHAWYILFMELSLVAGCLDFFLLNCSMGEYEKIQNLVRAIPKEDLCRRRKDRLRISSLFHKSIFSRSQPSSHTWKTIRNFAHDISYRMRVMIENGERAEEECAFEIWQSSEQHGLLGPLGLGQEARPQKIGLSWHTE